MQNNYNLAGSVLDRVTIDRTRPTFYCW